MLICRYLACKKECKRACFSNRTKTVIKPGKIDVGSCARMKVARLNFTRMFIFCSEEYSGPYKSRIYLIEENVRRYQEPTDFVEFYPPLLSTDQTLMKIYNSEQTYTTVKLPLGATVSRCLQIISGRAQDHLL